MEIAEFLLARIAEDKHEARWLGPCDCHIEGIPLRHGLRCSERVLADCESKRRIVELATGPVRRIADQAAETWGIPHEDTYADENLLRLLALPYAEHPDYREEWRP